MPERYNPFFDLMLMEREVINYGEGVALGASLVWASTSLVLRTLSQHQPSALITAIRCGISGPFFWMLLPFGPPLSTLVNVPLHEWGLLIGSVFIGIVIGDQLYLHAMKENWRIAHNGSGWHTSKLPHWSGSKLLLDVPVTRTFIFGCVLAASGVILLSQRPRQNRTDTQEQPIRLKRGIIFALLTALLWGLSTTMLKPAMAHLTSIQANSVRMPLVALALFGIWRLNQGRGNLRDIGWRTFALIAFTGLAGMGLGSFFYVEAVLFIGPAKTATVTTATPVLSLILAVIFLKDKSRSAFSQGLPSA